jgi:2-polyprenyl-3-methyl-5-hydroxy-6-metoxy-1,4-benzoquinol methylase
MKEHIPRSIKRIVRRLLFPVPARISRNFIQLDAEGLHSIEATIREHYHTGWRSEAKYSTDKYRADLNAHLYDRLASDRRKIIPWLDSVTALRDKCILEIGCGTGSSSIALAEQGAKVTGIDIDEGALRVARERSRIYGVNAEFRTLNAQESSSTFQANAFDLIIFFACLEHMTIAERLASLSDAWKMLPAGGLLAIIETPNRLWYCDGHTSMLPFFHWLPNELAFAYSKFSSRENVRELYSEYNATSKEHFLRRGRGASFHEIDLAIGPVRDLDVVSSLSVFEGLWYTLKRSRLERRYKSILKEIYPGIHEGFVDSMLYVVLRKK